jgi:hypothetical protein
VEEEEEVVVVEKSRKESIHKRKEGEGGVRITERQRSSQIPEKKLCV